MSPHAHGDPWPVIRVLGIFAIWMYVITPLIIKSKQKMDAKTGFEHFDPNNLPPAVVSHFFNNVQALVNQGFVVSAYLTKANAVTNATPILIYLVNRQTGDKATIAAIQTNVNGVTQFRSQYLEYTSRFTDDTWISTNNIGTVGAFKPTPQGRTTRFAGLNDPGLLYRIHKFVVGKYAPNKTKVLPEPGKEVEGFEKSYRESFEKQAEMGLLTLNATQGYYVTTFYGAYYMTLSLLWPFKQLRLLANKQEAARVMADFRRHGGFA